MSRRPSGQPRSNRKHLLDEFDAAEAEIQRILDEAKNLSQVKTMLRRLARRMRERLRLEGRRL